MEQGRASDRQPHRTELVLEVPALIWDSARAEAFGAFCAHLEDSQEIALPEGEVVVELCAEATIPIGWGLTTGPAVGCLVVWDERRRLTDHWRVVIAVGAEEGEDEAEWAARLASLPHELCHLEDFVRRLGGPPAHAACAGADVGAWARRQSQDEDRVEERARRITDRFLSAHPGWARRPS